MNLSINGKQLTLHPGLPKDFTGTRVPDSEPFYTTDSFGRIIIQRIKKLTYTITHKIFDFSEKQTIQSAIRQKGLNTTATFQHACTQTVIGSGRFHLQPMQFASVFARAMRLSVEIRPGAGTELLDCFWSDEYLHLNLPRDPAILKLFTGVNTIPSLIGQPYRPVTPFLQNVLASMLERPYIPELQQTYLDDLVQEYLLEVLTASTNHQWIQSYVQPGELQKVNKAVALITADLHKHYSNEEIAEIVGMHGGTLRLRFKQVTGKSMFDYLLYLRNKSICQRLLQTNDPIKAMHEDAGYRDRANFIKGFRKQFGCTPLDFRKDFGNLS